MKKAFPILVGACALLVSLAVADPGVSVEYRQGVPEVRLNGDFPGARYTILRANLGAGPFEPVSDANTLCTGICSLDDFDAQPGRTYWYRFDLELANGSFQSFGPYEVTIAADQARPVGATIHPNPGRGPVRVQLFLGGRPSAAPVQAEAVIYDLQGRELAVVHRGPLARGTSSLDWNGRARDGRALGAGVYFLKFTSPLGSTVTRVVRLN